MKPIMTVTEARREVNSIRDALGTPVDAGIKEFLIGLRRWGVETVMSCEGHLESALPFPWVIITFRSLPKSSWLLMQNYKRRAPDPRPFWVIEPSAEPRIRTLQEGYDEEELRQLQEEAKEFGFFLQNIPENYFGAEEGLPAVP